MEQQRKPLPDQDQRQLILCELDCNMLVEAAAGTGKTTSMVGRMVALLRAGKCKVRTMAAVTFTRKAAAELRARFQIELERALRHASGGEEERLTDALMHVGQCFIGTIHSFCARLLRERPVEAGVDPAFEELDADADNLLRLEAWRDYAARLMASGDNGLLDEFVRLGLRPAQLEGAFVTFADYPDVHDWPISESPLPLSDTQGTLHAVRQYLAHMRSLAPQLPQEWGNDNLIPEYYRLPRIFRSYPDLTHPPALMKFLRPFDKRGKAVQKEWKKGGFTKEEAKAEEDRWNLFRAEVVAPMFKAWRECRYAPALRALTHARAHYDSLRRERGKLNYQDLLLKAAALLREKPHVREYFRRRFSHLLVDEFQDTDPVQAEVMLFLTADDVDHTDWRQCRPRPGSLFVVGDPKQSIYRFRRADIVTYNEVRRIIEEAESNGRTAELRTNFRTTGSIINWVNGVFQTQFSECRTEQSPAYCALETGRSDGNQGRLAGLRTLRVPAKCKNQTAMTEYEADRIARTIRHAIDSKMTISRTEQQLQAGASAEVSPGDFMIVTLKTARLAAYARALQEYDIPHQVTGGSALNEVRELKLLHICLRAVAHADNPVFIVAALRSELFGISDAMLYDFKEAGGEFSYRSKAPTGKFKASAAFENAFAVLKKYSEWLAKLPPVAAIERIAADSGLMPLAASRPGGDVQAGSLAKAIEVLRSLQSEVWSVSQLVEHLGLMVADTGAWWEKPKYDGISARSRNGSVVRIMNLHKVKGLEAPVVFLAGPYGKSDHNVNLHIDRSGTHILGYMAVQEATNQWGNSEPLAHPPEWEARVATEQTFLEAESLRLKYVAATRAGSALIISQHADASKNEKNPWQCYLPFLDEVAELDDPGPQPMPVCGESPLTNEAVASGLETVASRRNISAAPTYQTWAAKEYALSPGGLTVDSTWSSESDISQSAAPSEGEHGTEWGSVIHRLLELAARSPSRAVEDNAGDILSVYGLDPARADEAVGVVRSVMASDIWQRAQQSQQCFTEPPFHIFAAEIGQDAPLPTVLRGAIDLVFREGDEWVLVDYKTTDPEREGLHDLVEKYAPQVRLYVRAWERATSGRVKEAGLFFTRTGEFVLIPIA